MRRIVILTFPGGQSLDVAGPLKVFTATERTSGTQRYTTEVVAPAAGPVRTMSGLGLVADAAIADVRGPIDTLFVAGGNEQGIGAIIGDYRAARRGPSPRRRVARGSRPCARARSCWPKPGSSTGCWYDPLGRMRLSGQHLSGGHGRSRPDLRARRQCLDLGGRDGGDGSGARVGGGGPRARGLCSPSLVAS